MYTTQEWSRLLRAIERSERLWKLSDERFLASRSELDTVTVAGRKLRVKDGMVRPIGD